MLRFRRMRSLQKFAAVHSSVYNHFNLRRSLCSPGQFQAQPRRCTCPVASTWGGLIPCPRWNNSDLRFHSDSARFDASLALMMVAAFMMTCGLPQSDWPVTSTLCLKVCVSQGRVDLPQRPTHYGELAPDHSAALPFQRASTPDTACISACFSSDLGSCHKLGIFFSCLTSSDGGRAFGFASCLAQAPGAQSRNHRLRHPIHRTAFWTPHELALITFATVPLDTPRFM